MPKTILRDAEDPRVVCGKWKRVRIWHTEEDHQAYLRGEFVLPKFSAGFPNGITDEGIEYLLGAGFRGTPAAISTWYAGLIDAAGFTGVNNSDTMASHSTWVENEDYDESVRQTLVFSVPATRQITAEISFTMNQTVTINGIFVVTDNVKGGTTGTLWSTALFASAPGLVPGNVLTANYTLSD